MARAPRVDVPGGRYHVINRGVDRGRIFFGDHDRVEFGRLLGDAHHRSNMRVLAYALMDNHFHLVVHCPDGGLSAEMQRLSGTFALHVNERTGRDGHLFAGRFFSRVITSDRHLLTTIRYVERNPLDLPNIDDPATYRWSSHRANAGYKRGPDWLDTRAVSSFFADADRYRRFVSQEGRRGPDVPFDTGILVQMVDVAIALHRPDDVTPQFLDRTVKLLLHERLPHEDGRRILEHLGYESRDAIGHALRSARRRRDAHPGIDDIVDAAYRLIRDAHGGVGLTHASGVAVSGRPDAAA